MKEFLHSFGVEWKILIAQVINFAILFFVLKRFVFKPVMRILERREQKIKTDKKAADETAQKFVEIAKTREEILRKTRAESQKIISDAETAAERLKDELKREAQREVEKIMAAGKKQIDDDRKKAEASLKKDIGGLVALAVEKSVGDALNKRAHEKLVDEAKRIILETDFQSHES